MTRDLIAELYEVADDREASILDDLRRRAGQTWDCLSGCGEWTNTDDSQRCERCGAAR